MEWNALPPNVGLDFDVDATSGFLNRFVVAPSTQAGEWAGLLRFFSRPAQQRQWDLMRTYLDVEAEFVSCSPHLLAGEPGGLVLHLLSRSGKRGSVVLMNNILTEVADKSKNYATVAVDKVKDLLYCGYNSRSEQQAFVEVFTDASKLAFHFRSRHQVPGMQRVSKICLQSNSLCITGYSKDNSQGVVSILRCDSLAPLSSTAVAPVGSPDSLWFDLECDPVAASHSGDSEPLQIQTVKKGELITYTFPKLRKSQVHLSNDRFGRLYVHIRTLADSVSNLFGPLELFFATFQVETRRQRLTGRGKQHGLGDCQQQLQSGIRSHSSKGKAGETRRSGFSRILRGSGT